MKHVIVNQVRDGTEVHWREVSTMTGSPSFSKAVSMATYHGAYDDRVVPEASAANAFRPWGWLVFRVVHELDYTLRKEMGAHD